jgi:hypothetical protein
VNGDGYFDVPDIYYPIENEITPEEAQSLWLGKLIELRGGK